VSNPVFAGTGAFSYPSGHSVDGYAEPLVLALVYPERYQQLVTRGAEYGINRVLNGAHYTMDIIASRALAYHDIAQLMANDPDCMGINIKSNAAAYTGSAGPVGEFLNVAELAVQEPKGGEISELDPAAHQCERIERTDLRGRRCGWPKHGRRRHRGRCTGRRGRCSKCRRQRRHR
jgi:hypothetical protein